MEKLLIHFGLLVCSMAILGCGDEEKNHTVVSGTGLSEVRQHPAPAIHFRNVAKEVGIDFFASNGQDKGHFAILESLGSGVAVLDFDQDGLLDILCAGGGDFDDTPRVIGKKLGLFRQRDSGKFDTVAEASGVNSDRFYSHGICVADYDNDGFSDVLVTGFRGLLLYRNLGDGTFEEVAAGSGLVAGDDWPTSAAWADFDNDGQLDLYVANYVNWSFRNHPKCNVQDHRDVCPPAQFKAQQDSLFRSNGDGTFTNVRGEVGLRADGKGLAVVAADYDLDGDIDIYVANDATENHMYRNDGQWKFEEVGLLGGTALGEDSSADGSMSADFGDFNMDGLPDLWVSNYESQTFALYRNNGFGNFQHVSSVLGINSVGASYVGFGAIFLDCDLDGDEDLLSTNGHVMYEAKNAETFQPPLVFENLTGEKYRNVASSAGDYFNSLHMGRGLTSGDLDNDGASDLVVSHTNQPLAVLLNSVKATSDVVQIQLIGTAASRDAIGAVVTAKTKADRVVLRQIKGGTSYLSTQSNLITLAGLGTNPNVEVQWPDGSRQMVQLSGGTRHILIQGRNESIKRLRFAVD